MAGWRLSEQCADDERFHRHPALVASERCFVAAPAGPVGDDTVTENELLSSLFISNVVCGSPSVIE